MKKFLKQLIENANNKKDFQEACFFIYSSLNKKYDFDKTQKILEIIENEYKIELKY